MAGMRGWAAVTGVAERKPTRWTDGETTVDMFAKIGIEAVRDAGLELSDIDGLICHPMAGVPMLVPSTMLEAMGIRASFAETVDLGGATGAGMVWRAAAAIHAGQAKAVLCVTASRRQIRKADGGPKRSGQSLGRGHYGVGRVRGAVRQRRRQRRLCDDRQPLPGRPLLYAGAVGKDRRAPARQRLPEPRCVLLRDPDHRRRRAQLADGGGPAALPRDRHALRGCRGAGGGRTRIWSSSTGRPAAWLLGAGECTTHKTITYAPSLMDTAIKPAADRAFAQAGIERSQVGLASLYDCYTITVLVTLEEAGFCGRGRGRGIRRRARPALERQLPGEHPRRPAELQSTRVGGRDEPRDRGGAPGTAARR